MAPAVDSVQEKFILLPGLNYTPFSVKIDKDQTIYCEASATPSVAQLILDDIQPVSGEISQVN